MEIIGGKCMDFSVRVDPEHFEFLRLQKGSLDNLAGDRVAWHLAYELDLALTFGQISPHLPPRCAELLDVGSGLGGIDVLIRRHYQTSGQAIGVSLLDGMADPPVMNLHRETFNDMRIAKNFQVKNGLSALKFAAYPAQAQPPVKFDDRFDLVVSFGSWCFHYPPALYLVAVYRALAPGATVILDVRAGKPTWLRQLVAALGEGVEIVRRPKWSRWVFRKVAR